MPSLPAGARGLGGVPADQPLQLTVALEPSDPAALESLATAVSTPGSPAYRDHLSVAEFVRRFSPTPTQIEAVAETLRGDGLEVGELTANHLTMPVSGSAAAVERAFASPLTEVRLAGGRTAYVNQAPPTLPAGVARYVQGVVGLNDLVLPHPQVTASPAAAASPQVVTGGPQPCSEAQEAGFGGLTADEIASAYQFSALYGGGDLGAGQAVALVELQPFSPSDIAIFQACYGTSASVIPIDVDGGPEPSLDDSEAALDIEQVIGLAPLAAVLVYQAPNTRPSGQADVISAIVSENRAKVISSSWAICEQIAVPALMDLENTLLQEAAVQGQSFFAATGDTGSAGCLRNDASEESLAVLDPSSQPFATAVGGTSLVSTGPPPEETVWNDGSAETGATGGGTSIHWPMPSYQAGASPALGVTNTNSQLCAPSTYCRQVPDVAADADPLSGYIIRANEEWVVYAGTSAAAPLWAALAALTNADPACRGRTIGFVNPALYAIAGSAYAANFHDVTAGSDFSGFTTNDVFSGEGPYPVTAGYDMTTGLGTPVGSTLAASLCAVASPVYTVSLANPGTRRSTTKRPVSMQITGSDSGGLGLAYSATGLPPGLAINPATGLITGVPAQVGVWTVTVSASDAFTNAGTTQFSWGIVRLKTVRVSHVKLRGVAARRPRLSFKIAVGKHSPRLQAIKVSLPRGLSFSSAKRPLYAGVKILAKHGKHGRVRLRVHHGALLIHLPQPAPKAKVMLRWPALRASAKLATRVARHKQKKLKIVIGATDAAGHGARFAVHARAR